MINCSQFLSLKRYFFNFTALLVFAVSGLSSIQGYSEISETEDVMGSNNKASISRSDSINLLHTHIYLDITDFTTRRIKGFAEIKLVPKKNNISTLYFDLLKLNVDSVLIQGSINTFFHNDTVIKIPLTSSIGISDTTIVRIYYQGSPVKDNSWGGFYYSGNYAYNLGVAFTSAPHNYGRVWFPCFDNFVERCTFSFSILTADKRKAHCNGSLLSEISVGVDSTIREWEITEEIPSYLVCVAVSDYETIRWQHQGINKLIPIEIAARKNDTTNVKNSFLHLNDAIDAYEFAFGPYLFNKVGFSIVPFNAGAMEHATNIAYPRYAVNGSLANESLMAHELSHHWWGDLVTCQTDADMWINEGMASYCEQLFTEYFYGKEPYLNEAKANLTNVLQYAHIREQEYRAITNLPHQYTYGIHTYDKGAVVAYNLRSYLGDSLFFNGCTDFLTNRQFEDVTSNDLKNDLSAYSGKDLTPFFNQWVYNEGFAHFSIDSFKVESNGGNFDVSIFVRQKLRGAPGYFTNVPIAINYYDVTMSKSKVQAEVSGQYQTLNVTLPFEPVYLQMNPENFLNLAMTADEKTIRDTGFYEFTFGKMEVEVHSLKDSTLLNIVHNWASPDPLKATDRKIRLSNYRYWTVEGILDDEFSADATIYFDGRNIQSGGDGHLDYDLLRTGEDSLLLMYRRNASEDWTEFRNYKVNNLASISDRYGSISIKDLKLGEYTLAKGETVVGSSVLGDKKVVIQLFPNPTSASGLINFKGVDPKLVEQVEILDANGKLIRVESSINSNSIDINGLPNGLYFFRFKIGNDILESKAVLTM